jgi:hypothetical protein
MMLAAHLPLAKCTFTREDELDKFVQEKRLEAAAYALAANPLAKDLPLEFDAGFSNQDRSHFAHKAIRAYQEARSAESLRQELKVIRNAHQNYEDLLAAPEDVPLSENAKAQERLEIIDWLDPLCNWDSSAPTAEQRMARRVRQFLMDRQNAFEGRYC